MFNGKERDNDYIPTIDLLSRQGKKVYALYDSFPVEHLLAPYFGDMTSKHYEVCIVALVENEYGEVTRAVRKHTKCYPNFIMWFLDTYAQVTYAIFINDELVQSGVFTPRQIQEMYEESAPNN